MSPAALLTVAPITSALGRALLPGSKSASIRAMLMAAHASGSTTLRNLLVSDDGQVMHKALETLGFNMVLLGDDLHIDGASAAPVKQALLAMGNSGLSIRTLLPALAGAGGHYRFSGVPRMHQRPIGDLVSALTSIGALIE